MITLSLVFVYSLAVTIIALSFECHYIFLGFILVANIAFVHLFGGYLIRAIIFPYANYFIQRRMDSMLNDKFAKEFHKLLTQVLGHVKLMAKLTDHERPDPNFTELMNINSSKDKSYVNWI